MSTYEITGPDGKKFDVTAPDGATQDEVLAYAQKNFKMAAASKAPAKPFGQQLNDVVADVPRQLGLTARAGLRAIDSTANMIGAPLRAGLNAILPKQGGGIAGQITGEGQRDAIGPVDLVGMAERFGLPRPRPGLESFVNDAATTGFSAAAPMAAGSALARGTAGTAQRVGQLLAANPAQQVASAAAAGGAGGYTRETGGNEGSQLLASLAAGVGAPMAMNAAGRVGQAAQRMAGRLSTSPAPSPVQVEVTINNAIHPSGMTLADLPAEVAAGIRADVAKAMQIGDDLSPDAVRRLADYRLVGATPNRAGLTLDPAAVTQQRNLAKLGINSKDPAAQQLGQMQNANNRQLTTGLNALGANTADDAIAGAGRVMGALDQRNARAKDIIDTLYQRARDTEGRSAALDPHAFTQRAGQLLNEKNVESFLTPDIRNKLNGFATGDIPLNVDIAEQLKTSMAAIQRSSADGNVRTALGAVRQALDDAPLLPGQQIGQDSINAFNKARGMNRAWMGIVDKTPALQAVRDGIEPDKFVQQFIVGTGQNANVMDVAMLKNSIKGSPDAMDAVRTQITAFLKQKALSGAADEAGNFSQSAYNKALNAIGERKLRLFFESDQINQMKAIGRVASYEQFQPVGAAVNNSNTAGAAGAMLERLGGSALLNKIPFGKAAVGDPLQNIVIGMQAKKTLDVPQALANGIRRPPLLPAPRAPSMALSPAALLGMESEEERRRREAGLLFP